MSRTFVANISDNTSLRMEEDDLELNLGEQEEGMDFNDFMGGIQDQLKTMMKETSKAPATAWEHWNAFAAAVDWTETWIRVLICFHVFVWLFVLITRKNVDCQTFAFLTIAAVVFMSERLNTYAGEHWQEFSKQNYFDKHGVFTGLMLSGPLILVLMFQLINFLRLTSSALIKSKRMELKKKYNKEKANQATAAASDDSNVTATSNTTNNSKANKKTD